MSEIDVIINDERWRGAPLDVSSIIELARAHLTIKKTTNLSVLLSNDEDIQQFNATYRAKDKPTNVLSFPCDSIKGYVGDLVLSYETIKKECQSSGKELEEHATHMIVHGFLHLLGYDHVVESEAEIMETHEVKILASLNIKNPYDG